MGDTFTVSFFGLRVIENPLRIEQRLDALIRRIITEKEYAEFLVKRKEGGAYQTMRYATQQGKQHINLADKQEESQ